MHSDIQIIKGRNTHTTGILVYDSFLSHLFSFLHHLYFGVFTNKYTNKYLSICTSIWVVNFSLLSFFFSSFLLSHTKIPVGKWASLFLFSLLTEPENIGTGAENKRKGILRGRGHERQRTKEAFYFPYRKRLE